MHEVQFKQSKVANWNQTSNEVAQIKITKDQIDEIIQLVGS